VGPEEFAGRAEDRPGGDGVGVRQLRSVREHPQKRLEDQQAALGRDD